MKIQKCVEFKKTVVIELSVEDLRKLYSETSGTEYYGIAQLVNDFHLSVKAISDEQIDRMGVNIRNMIATALDEQAKRFATTGG